MTIIFKTEKKFALKCQYEDRHVAKSIGGIWNSETKTWDFPQQTTIIKQLQGFFPRMVLTREIEDMVKEEAETAARLLNLQEQADTELSVDYADKLRDYQRVGVEFLSTAGNCILADDMGTGKTVQAITACEESGAGKVLIVCPATLKWNWFNEIKQWTGKEGTIIQGTKNKRLEQIAGFTDGYMIINYEALRLHPELKKVKWDIRVFDEAHKLKNRKAQQTKAAKLIKSKKTFQLTGTPMLNRADELYSLLNMLYPKKYTSYWRFVDQFCQTYDNGFGKDILQGKPEQVEALRAEIQPVMLRRTKQDVLAELPAKTYVRHTVELNGKQRKMYKEMHDEAVTMVGDELVAASVVIAQITRLRQIAISTQMLNPEVDLAAKVDALLEIIEDNADHKIAVFSQFRTAIEIVGRKLDEKGVGWVSVTGKVSEDDRTENTRKFQEEPDCKVMLATIAAAGVGLTWTSSDIAVFLDRHWTPAINRQAEDRLHRMGQRNNVTIINIVAKDTIEERIENMLAEKQDNFDSIIEHGIDPEEVRSLFFD